MENRIWYAVATQTFCGGGRGRCICELIFVGKGYTSKGNANDGEVYKCFSSTYDIRAHYSVNCSAGLANDGELSEVGEAGVNDVQYD